MQKAAFDYLKPLGVSSAPADPRYPQSSHPSGACPLADEAAISVAELSRHAAYYIEDCECTGQSPATLQGKKDVAEKLLWFLRRSDAVVCTVSELRKFLIYLQKGHLEPGGRWGQKHLTRPVGQRTVRYYYIYLQGMFKWLVAQGILAKSPVSAIAKPPDPTPSIHVFSDEQIIALLEAAARSASPRRNIALLLFLLDTGARISEVCALRVGDIDLYEKSCEVMGKGKKRRNLHFVSETATALRNYFILRYGSVENRKLEEPLFINTRGIDAGRALTRSGALQLMKRLAKGAGIEGVRCSPHTFRHTFATKFSASAGPSTTLQTLLGHSTLYMTSRYVHLAEADIRNQHRRYSPVAGLMAGIQSRGRHKRGYKRGEDL